MTVILKIQSVNNSFNNEEKFTGRQAISNANRFIKREFFDCDIVSLIKEDHFKKDNFQFWFLTIKY